MDHRNSERCKFRLEINRNNHLNGPQYICIDRYESQQKKTTEVMKSIQMERQKPKFTQANSFGFYCDSQSMRRPS